jgi:SAM-dependent methyltransferase
MTRSKIAREWDAIAEHRCNQLALGKDVSHDLVLVPSLLRLVKELGPRRILDVGSGCGFLTAKLSLLGAEVLGIDISKQMVLQAEKRFSTRANLRFQHASIAEFATSCPRSFDLAISNMAVSTMENLASVFQSVFSILRRHGTFVFSVTHPFFWNCYRHAEPFNRFNYWKEHPVTAPFRITLEPKSRFKTTYFHRPLATYLNSLAASGFNLQNIVEPQVSKSAPIEYRRNFQFPRFLIISAKRV